MVSKRFHMFHGHYSEKDMKICCNEFDYLGPFCDFFQMIIFLLNLALIRCFNFVYVASIDQWLHHTDV